MKPVVVSTAAEADLAGIVDHYLIEAGGEVAVAFLTAWERCAQHIAQFPESGSPRLGKELQIDGLRVWPIRGFPHLTFYREEAEKVAVIRILHTARDIPAFLRA